MSWQSHGMVQGPGFMAHILDVGALYNAPTHVTRIWCLAYILYHILCITGSRGSRWKQFNVLVGLL